MLPMGCWGWDKTVTKKDKRNSVYRLTMCIPLCKSRVFPNNLLYNLP